MENGIRQLKDLAGRIFASASPIETSAELKSFIVANTSYQLSPQMDIAAGETRLQSGLAISPTMAAMCANEPLRTHQFILGMHQAVEELLTQYPARTVTVLYAGCGPWATLALPLMAYYSAAQLQITFMDIHAESIKSVQELIHRLGLENRAAGFEVADASEFCISGDNKPDILLTETMNQALRNEPQIGICRNILYQAPNAILIPEQVRVTLAQLDPGKEHSVVSSNHEGDIPPPKRKRNFLGDVFTLNKTTIAQWTHEKGATLPAATVELPKLLDPRLHLTLLTEIKVYGSVKLEDYQCSLTLPMRLKTDQHIVAGLPLNFSYRLGDHPGLVAWQDITPSEQPEILGIDRQKLPLSFDIERLRAELERFEEDDWIDHFVKQNYSGSWQAIPLRAQAGATHPIQQIFSNPGCDDFRDTGQLKRSSYLTEVLQQFQCELLSVRLMKLKAGSRIKEHIDPDLGLEDGYARLHIPITTNPQLEFSLNGKQVVMSPGECWYLRLSDPHYINNNGATDRVHIVLDMKANEWLSSMIENAQRMEA